LTWGKKAVLKSRVSTLENLGFRRLPIEFSGERFQRGKFPKISLWGGEMRTYSGTPENFSDVSTYWGKGSV